MNWVLVVVLSGPLGIREVEHKRFETGQECIEYLDSNAMQIWKKYPLSIGQSIKDMMCKNRVGG